MITGILRSPWQQATALLLVKLAAGGLALVTGFRAVSDDDFARVVIAQRFAESPLLDPTGSSWLPLPFWVYGLAQGVFGSTLEVARGTAIVLGCLSVLLVWRAARVLGLSPPAAFLGAVAAAIFPYSVYLGVATVPELPTAALTLFGAATLIGGLRDRALGALALTAACGSRYEAWPVALVFSLVTLWDVSRGRDRRLAASAFAALAFPLLWLLHGMLGHQDALFFVARVSAYRSALGFSSQHAAHALFSAPAALITREPELVVAFLTMLGVLVRAGKGFGFDPSRIRRAVFTLAAIPVLVIVGDLQGSGPTHHPERALLALWLGLALLLGGVAEAVLGLPNPVRHRTLLIVAAAAFGGGWLVRSAVPREPFVNRTSEVLIGESARRLGAERLLIDAPDFGFFAVQAAYGSPNQTRVLDQRDPRTPRPTDPLESAEAFLGQQATQGFRWLALPKARLARLRELGRPRAQNAGWVLIEWTR